MRCDELENLIHRSLFQPFKNFVLLYSMLCHYPSSTPYVFRQTCKNNIENKSSHLFFHTTSISYYICAQEQSHCMTHLTYSILVTLRLNFNNMVLNGTISVGSRVIFGQFLLILSRGGFCCHVCLWLLFRVHL